MCTRERVRFGELRSALQSAPSRAAFDALVDLVEQWPEEHWVREGAPYARGILRRWPDPLRVAPQRWVERFMDLDGRFPPMAIASTLEWVHKNVDDDVVDAIASSPWIDGLRVLHLGRLRRVPRNRDIQLDEGRITELARSERLTELVELNVAGHNFIESSLQRILTGPSLRNLGALDVSFNMLGGLHPTQLHSAPCPLHTLIARDSAINPRGIDFLVHCAVLRPEHLRTLDLSHNPIGGIDNELLAEAIAKLLGALGEALEELNLSGCELEPLALQHLMGATHLSNLRVLRLDQHAHGDAAAMMLSRAEHVTKLHTLSLASTQLGDEGLVALSGAESLGALRVLRLSDNPNLTPRGLRALASSPMLSGLRTLRLNHLPIEQGALEELRGALPGCAIEATPVLADDEELR
ncbi:MAG: hypothetical protein AAGI01_04690 [Myxococcota bacterium]